LEQQGEAVAPVFLAVALDLVLVLVLELAVKPLTQPTQQMLLDLVAVGQVLNQAVLEALVHLE
jgi:hypothetical protein